MILCDDGVVGKQHKVSIWDMSLEHFPFIGDVAADSGGNSLG